MDCALRILACVAICTSPGQAQADNIVTCERFKTLQDCIDAATVNGTRAGVAVLPSNHRTEIRAATLLFSNTTLRCEVGSKIIGGSGVTGALLRNADQKQGNENISIEGCTLDGGKLGHAVSGISLIGPAYRVRNVRISGVTIQHTSGSGFYGQGLEDLEIDHSSFVDTQTGNVGAIQIDAENAASRRVDIHHNRCDGSVSHSSCFKFAGSTKSPLTQLRVTDNTIVVGDAGTVPTLGIELFTTDNGHDTGVQRFIIVNNIVEAETLSSPNAFCISLGGARYGSVRGNLIRGCAASGIEGICSYTVISDNVLDHSGPIMWDANAGSHQDIVIKGNVLVRPAGRGIHLIQSGPNVLRNGVISDNVIDMASQSAIRVQGSDAKQPRIRDVLITNNQIASEMAGISAIETFGASTGVEISRNKLDVSGVGATAISVGAADEKPTVRDSTIGRSATSSQPSRAAPEKVPQKK